MIPEPAHLPPHRPIMTLEHAKILVRDFIIATERQKQTTKGKVTLSKVQLLDMIIDNWKDFADLLESIDKEIK